MADLPAVRVTAITLASRSPGRSALLARICDDFATAPADIDESAQTGEKPEFLAARLALEKACAVARGLADSANSSIVIGADQVATCDGRVLEKPGNAQRNIEMLMACSEREAVFFSAVCVLDSTTNQRREHTNVTRVRFDSLTRERVARYVARDEPWHCAGGFMVERAGISLFRSVHSDDPTGLIGLPLIFVSAALREFGYPA